MQLKEIRMFQPCYVPLKSGRKLLEYLNDELHTLVLNDPFIVVTDRKTGLSTWITIYNTCYLVPHDNDSKTAGDAAGTQATGHGISAMAPNELSPTDSVHKGSRKAKSGPLHS